MKQSLHRIAMVVLCTMAFITKGFTQPLPCPPVETTIVSAGANTTVCPGACTNLQAFDSTSLKSTTSYSADTTVYLPFAFDFGTQVLVNIDDAWSDSVDLPFQFCFFGQKYNKIQIGANGQITFNVGFPVNQGGTNAYNVPGPLPNNYNSYNNCILAPFYDMDPTTQGKVRYATYGVAPCRTFVVSWDSLGTYPCLSVGGSGCAYRGSQQVVLYETTYAIDIFIKEKNFFTGSTSSGNAVLGIQNDNATQSYTFPGKNGGQWTSYNEGFRFTPNGIPSKFLTWTNLNNGIVVGATDTINVCPLQNTDYQLAVTYYSQCDSFTVYDTVSVNILAATTANFDFDIQYGCDGDTVYFTNTSTNNTFNIWDFADGTGDTAVNPIHVYTNQNTYNVKLITQESGGCKDSITKTIDTQHPLEAAFTVDKDSVCQGALVTFSNASNYTTIEGPAHFLWVFGDGTVDTNLGTTHIYPYTGVYTAMLVVTDFVPCSDTAYKVISVDSMPSLNFIISDSSLCEGQGVNFAAYYTENGNENIFWDFGDGNFVANQDVLAHAYDTSGLYTVALTGEYRICPDTTYTRQIEIRPFPSINLGPDTTLCQGGAPLMLRDISNFSNPAATWAWNTGDSGMATIVARHPGVYTATVTLNGCSSTDSVTIGKDCYLDIPNAFSPNGDNNNDYFLPRQLLSLGLTGFKMTVYNRWGQEIFATVKLDGRGWDGKFNDTEQPEGVYIYLIEAILKNGHSEKYQGNVTLLR